MDPLKAKTVQSLSAMGEDFTTKDVCRIIDGIANVPANFRASDLVGYVQSRDEPFDGPNSYHLKQEVLNRLFQRWRKLDLVRFEKGRWKLASGAWEKMQAAVYEASRLKGEV